ncbi:MAG TPA: DUF309 domain-containing protein [Candidatus Dormibacteraeota bacterium]|nr:DUF309 domain-containing protein [Candidatus Dormibacteraeota bacterium]
MRFLVRLANEGKFQPGDSKALASKSYASVRGFGADVGNVRVSSTAIELDLLLTSRDKLESATHALAENLGPMLTLRELDSPGPQTSVGQAIHDGIEFFNEERYWESHEALEYAWRRAEGAEKKVLQGIILVAAALVHLQKNESAVAVGVMARARDKLSAYHGERFGVSVDGLHETISRMVEAGRPQFFKIEARAYSSRAAV